MRNKFSAILLLLSLTMMLGACVGPPADGKCIPSDSSGSSSGTGGGDSTGTGTGTGTGSTGSNQSIGEQIDAYLKANKIVTTIVTKIKTEIIGDGSDYSGSQGIFEGFTQSPDFQTAIGGAFSLFIIFYGISVISGVVQASLGDAVIRVSKVAFIAIIALNWGTFYQYIGSFFVNATDELIGYFLEGFQNFYQGGSGADTGGGGDTSGGTGSGGAIFTGYDDLISRVFSYQMFAFIGALMNAGQYAPVYGLVLILSLWWVFQSILRVVTIYIFSLFAKALLFAVAPIFFAFLLFNQTRRMFDAWLNQLVSFTLQPVLATAYIGVFGNLMLPFFDEFKSFKECWNHVGDSPDDFGWTFVNKNTTENSRVAFSASSQPPISLQAVMLFGFFSWLFMTTLKMTESLVSGIVQTATANLGQAGSLSNLAAMAKQGGGGLNSGNALKTALLGGGPN